MIWAKMLKVFKSIKGSEWSQWTPSKWNHAKQVVLFFAWYLIFVYRMFETMLQSFSPVWLQGIFRHWSGRGTATGTSAISNTFYTCQGLHFCHLAVAPISLDSCLSPQKYWKPCLRFHIKPSLVARDLPPLEWHRRHLWRTPSQPLMCHQTIFLQPRRQICAKMCAISNKFCALSNQLCACHSVKGSLSTSWVDTCVTWQLRPTSYLLPVFPLKKVLLGSWIGYLGRQR